MVNEGKTVPDSTGYIFLSLSAFILLIYLYGFFKIPVSSQKIYSPLITFSLLVCSYYVGNPRLQWCYRSRRSADIAGSTSQKFSNTLKIPLRFSVKFGCFLPNSPLKACEIQSSLMVLSVAFVSILLCYLSHLAISHVMPL